MSGKGIDYSKWDHIDDVDGDEAHREEYEEGEEEEEAEQSGGSGSAALSAELGTEVSATRGPLTGGPTVSQLKGGSRVTIGPSGVTVVQGDTKSSAATTPSVQPQPPSQATAVRQDSLSDAELKIWAKYTHNGTFCDGMGYLLAQEKQNATISIVLAEYGSDACPSKNALLPASAISRVWFQTAKTLCVKYNLASRTNVPTDVGAPLMQRFGPIPSSKLSLPSGEQALVLKYPLDDTVLSGDDASFDWELLTIHAPVAATNTARWLRVLRVTVPKAVVGQGVYLWWDRVFELETEATLDVVNGVAGRSKKQAEAFKDTWNSAQTQFAATVAPSADNAVVRQ